MGHRNEQSPLPSKGGPRRIRRALRTAGVVIVADALIFTVLSIGVASIGAEGFRPPGGPGFFGGQGGTPAVVGVVTYVGSSSFTVADRHGGTVTVDEGPSTTYSRGPTTASSIAVAKDAVVAVQGVRTSNAVSATHVIVLSGGGLEPPPS